MSLPQRTIFFNEKFHKYTDEFNAVYTPVTQLIGQYEPPFDADKWSKYKAKERGVSQATILAEWAATNKHSINVGNDTHKYLEDNIKVLYGDEKRDIKALSETAISLPDFKVRIDKIEQLDSLGLKDEYPDIYWELSLNLNNGWVIYAEKRVYNPFYFIAGTIDCLLIRGAEFKILDWKTNKKDLKFEAGYYKKEWKVIDGIRVKVETSTFIRTREYMHFPLNNIQVCKGMVYTLQLSIYAFLIEQFGLKCVGLKIYHIKSTDVVAKKAGKLAKVPVKVHRIDYKKEDVYRLMEHHKNKPDNPNNKKFAI